MQLIAYTDGSWHPQEPGAFGYGAVILKNDKPIAELYGHITDNPEMAKMRNIAGEIKAAICAIAYAREHGAESLTLYHDYQGIAKWADLEWKAKNPYTQNYRDFVNKARETMSISFIHVKAHTGNRYNEEADRLANKGFYYLQNADQTAVADMID